MLKGDRKMKAVVVIDEMPEYCVMCKFRLPFGRYDKCLIDGHKYVIQSETCPLKPLPDYEVNNDPDNEYHKRWVNGYNAFLRYLNGEEDDTD